MLATEFTTALELPLRQLIDFANDCKENRRLLINYAKLNGCAVQHLIDSVIA